MIWITAAAADGGLALFNSQAPLAICVVLPLAFLGGALFMLWILYGTSSAIRDKALHIRNGPFRTTVPLPEVDFVHPFRDPTASRENSLDRLLIGWSHGRRHVLISPQPKQDFLQVLAEHAPHLDREADGLERVEGRPTGADGPPRPPDPPRSDRRHVVVLDQRPRSAAHGHLIAPRDVRRV